MISTDSFNSDPGSDFEEEENYPTAFGITFTPQVSGIAFGILGLLAALYIIFNFDLPALNNYQKIKQTEQEKQDQVERQKSGSAAQKFAQVESELNRAKATKAQVLSLFSSEKTLDTLLFDISNLASAKKVKLTSFEPQAGGAKAINDGSLGKEVDGKLKRDSINLVMEGSFENTKAFLLDLERLQPLLLIKNVNFSLDPQELVGTVYVDTVQKTAKVVPGPQNKLNTSFTLEAILPLSTEELKEIAAKKPEGEGGQGQDKK